MKNKKSNIQFMRYPSFEKCMDGIKEIVKEQEQTIENLRKKVSELNDEHFRDEKLNQLQKELEKVKSDCQRGFPITEEEQRIIQEWKDTHFKEKHRDRNLNWAEAIGGRFTYTFIPTSIGVIGEVTCSCGESMTFSNLM
jgi:hypothetical protein